MKPQHDGFEARHLPDQSQPRQRGPLYRFLTAPGSIVETIGIDEQETVPVPDACLPLAFTAPSDSARH
jgi:hypothetical protein